MNAFTEPMLTQLLLGRTSVEPRALRGIKTTGMQVAKRPTKRIRFTEGSPRALGDFTLHDLHQTVMASPRMSPRVILGWAHLLQVYRTFWHLNLTI
jgi:hypothetical protein